MHGFTLPGGFKNSDLVHLKKYLKTQRVWDYIATDLPPPCDIPHYPPLSLPGSPLVSSDPEVLRPVVEAPLVG